MQDMKLVDISGTKERNMSKLKFIKFTLTVRSQPSETCTGASMTVRKVTILELI